jgi:hypothetical protein
VKSCILTLRLSSVLQVFRPESDVGMLILSPTALKRSPDRLTLSLAPPSRLLGTAVQIVQTVQAVQTLRYVQAEN